MQSIAETYQLTQVMSASPLVRLLMVYDYALSACKYQDLESLTRALCVLIESLDLRYEQAHSLLAIYQWCAQRAREGDFDEAKRTLMELRNAWAEAGKRTPAVDQPGHPQPQAEWQMVSTTA